MPDDSESAVEVVVTEGESPPTPPAGDDAILASISLSGLASTSQATASLSNLAFSNVVQNTGRSQQNAVTNQQALNETDVAITGATVNEVSRLGPLESRSAVDVQTNNELAQTLADLRAAMAALAGQGDSTSSPVILSGKIYTNAPHSFVFPGEQPSNLKISKETIPIRIDNPSAGGGGNDG